MKPTVPCWLKVKQVQNCLAVRIVEPEHYNSEIVGGRIGSDIGEVLVQCEQDAFFASARGDEASVVGSKYTESVRRIGR